MTIDRFRGEYAFLSNFYPCVVRIALDPDKTERLVCYSVEHAFQALKTTDANARRRIATAPTASEAKRRGRDAQLRPAWDEKRLAMMRSLLAQKFGPAHPHLARQLLDTGDAELVEGNTWGDRFWGVCDGVGENHLGRLLMERRAYLRAA